MSETSKKDKTTSKTIKQIITKKPYEERIGPFDYTYSLLNKVSESSLFSNERLLILAGTQVLGYSRQIPQATLLPFGSADKIPINKSSIDLQDIVKVTTNKELLTIQYLLKKQDRKWEFKCNSKDCADQWKRRIQIAIDMRKQEDAKGAPIVLDQNSSNPNSLNNPNNIVDPNNPNFNNSNFNNINVNSNVNNSNSNNLNNTLNNTNPNNFSNNQGINAELRQENVQNPISNIQSERQRQIKENKPLTSYFVGGVAVNSQRDLLDFKDQIGSIQKLNEQMKQKYAKKKIQQQQLKHEIQNQPIQSVMGQIINSALDQKYLLEKLNQDWSYQFAKGVNEFQIVDQFRAYLSILVRRVIDEFGLQPRKRYYQPSKTNVNSQDFQVNGVKLQIINCELKQVSTTGYVQRQRIGSTNSGTIVGNDYAKLARQQFKNYDYLLRLTNNKGKIRVPLSAILEYKGFTIFAKSIVPYTQTYDFIDGLRRELDLLQTQSRINNSVFEDPDCARIMALNSKVFEKISRSESISRKYDICYIDEAQHYLPTDFTRFNKDRSYQKMRFQLIQDEENENKLFNGENMANVMTRLKIPQNLRNGINELSNLSKVIPQRIDLIVRKLQQLDEVITNSIQLSELMHGYGVNMRYLGMVVEKVKQPWLKAIINSQIAARCAKHFLRFDIHDSTINLNQKSVGAVDKFQSNQVINFLNKMVGTGSQTDIFWKKLNKQAQTYFYVSLNKEEVNHGYLMQAIIHHCRINLRKLPPLIQFFKSGNSLFFHQDQFQGFNVHFTGYDLGFTQLYKIVSSYLSDSSRESYDKLTVLLNLSRSSIPTHFKMSNHHDQIVCYLSNWLSPEQGKDIYYPPEFQLGEIIPSKALYQIKLTEIRWALKNNQESKSQIIRDWIVDHVNKWLGSYHPILTQLYDIYSSYYSLKKDQQKKAVNYCKSSIKNQQKLITNDSVKLAEGYFQLGSIYINYGRKIQALNIFKRAKEVFTKNRQTETEAYGIVCLKMGQLYLALDQTEEAQKSGFEAVDQLSTGYQKAKFIQSIELVCRCFEIAEKWNTYVQFNNEFLMTKVKEFVDEPELLEKIIKIIILPKLKDIARHSSTSTVAEKLLHIIKQLPESTRSPNMAYNYIKNRVLESTLPSYFLDQLAQIEEVLNEIQSNSMVARWKGFETISNKTMLNRIGSSLQNKGFDFLANLQALSIFLGHSFIEGTLMEH